MSESSVFRAVMGGLEDQSEEAARAVMAETYHRIVGLVRRRIGARFQAKVDAESVANSVLNTFFRRHADEPFALADWTDVWSLLAEIALHKLSNRVRWFQQAKRSVAAERGLLPTDRAGADEPDGQAVVDDLLDHLMAGYTDQEKAVIEQGMQGYSVDEVADRVGLSKRTVIRVRTRFRERLEAARAAEPG